MITATLKDVAPARASSLSFHSDDVVWHLNLDQVEPESGRILKKITGPYSEAGSSTQAFDTENVLYSKLRPYLNKVVCPDDLGVATTELVPLRPDPDRLGREYLAYYLRSPQFVKWVSNEVAGAKMPRVSMKVFWAHQIPLPPLAEQKRIAGILDVADALRAKRRESLAQLDTLLQSTFLDMFGDPVTNPMGWEVKTMKEVAPAQPSKFAFKPNKNVWHLNLDQIESQTGRVLNKIYGPASAAGSSTHVFDCSNVLYSKLRPYLNKVICPDAAGIATTELVPLTPKPNELERSYLTYFLRSPQFVKWVSNEVAGAKMPRVSMKVFWGNKLPIPPLDLQQRFAAIVESVERQKAHCRAHLDELDTLFASLQSRAFKGEL